MFSPKRKEVGWGWRSDCNGASWFVLVVK